MTLTELPEVTEVLEPEKGGRVAAVAARLRCTEGQLYSMVIALTASTALILTSGVPLGGSATSASSDLPAPLATGAPSAPPAVVVAPEPPAPVPPASVGTGTPLALNPPFVAPSVVQTEPSPSLPAAPPRATLSDYRVPAPGLPRALAADLGHVYAGTDNSAGASRLFVFSRTDEPTRQVAVTGQPAQHDGGLSAAAVSGGLVLATDRGRGALVQIDPRTGSQRTVATLPDLPPCVVGLTGTCQPGAQDLKPAPEGLAVIGGDAFVADPAQGTIWRVALATGKTTAWYSSSDFASGKGPSGLAVDAKGALVFTAGETADSAALLQGALYRIEVTPTGPGTRTLLASFASGETPGPVAVGSSGAVYVGLRGTGGVVAVTNGKVTQVASASRAPAPGGLSIVDDTLYVADAGKPTSPTSGRVLALTL